MQNAHVWQHFGFTREKVEKRKVRRKMCQTEVAYYWNTKGFCEDLNKNNHVKLFNNNKDDRNQKTNAIGLVYDLNVKQIPKYE